MFGLVNNKEGTIMWNIQIHLLPLNSTNELLDIFHYKSAPSNEIEILLTIRCSETVLHVSDVSKYFAHNNVITGKRIKKKTNIGYTWSQKSFQSAKYQISLAAPESIILSQHFFQMVPNNLALICTTTGAE